VRGSAFAPQGMVRRDKRRANGRPSDRPDALNPYPIR